MYEAFISNDFGLSYIDQRYFSLFRYAVLCISKKINHCSLSNNQLETLFSMSAFLIRNRTRYRWVADIERLYYLFFSTSHMNGPWKKRWQLHSLSSIELYCVYQALSTSGRLMGVKELDFTERAILTLFYHWWFWHSGNICKSKSTTEWSRTVSGRGSWIFGAWF